MYVAICNIYNFFFLGAERVLHLKSNMPTELPPLIIEMLDRAENVYTPKPPASTEPKEENNKDINDVSNESV